MELPSYFSDFLTDIRPTAEEREDAQSEHKRLREQLEADEELGPLIVATFLHGGYRRATALRGHNGKRLDVDVIVVTTLHEADHTPDAVLVKFTPFLEKHYKGKWKPQGRSICITLSNVTLDLVPTSAPSEAQMRTIKAIGRIDESLESVDERELSMLFKLDARAEEQWRREPLRIPDRDAKRWEDTHPLEQMRWTWRKNKACDGHYVNAVKGIKWWRSVQILKPERPKGYPVEHLIGLSCPDGVGSVAQAVTRTLEDIAVRYEGEARAKRAPVLFDHGVPSNNVMKRVSGDDFSALHAEIRKAATLARRALDAEDLEVSAKLWRELFGDKFPPPPTGSKASFSSRSAPTIVSGGRFA